MRSTSKICNHNVPIDGPALILGLPHATRQAATIPVCMTSNHLLSASLHLYVGSTLDHFRASPYETLCANPDLPDAIALPALESSTRRTALLCCSR